MKFKILYNRLTTVDGEEWGDPLQDSINKWETIVEYIEKEGKIPDERGQYYCGLCRTYWDTPDGWCFGCPVRIATGKQGCMDSPYDTYCNAEEMVSAASKGDLPGTDETDLKFFLQDALMAAKDELAFLKSLAAAN